MEKYYLLNKDGKVFFDIPEEWTVLNNTVYKENNLKKTIKEMINISLKNPIGSPPISEIVKKSDKIAIILDDFTRPTPKKEILSCLIDELDKVGVNYKNIKLIFATGTHRPVCESEVKEILPRKLEKEIYWINHDCHSKDCVSVGILPSGIELKINRVVADSDFRIGVGSLMPHVGAGFGGGGKIILPGVTEFETIKEHHFRHLLDSRTHLGNIRDNYFLHDLIAAGKLGKLDFLINTLYDPACKVNGFVSGDFEKAFFYGAEVSGKEQTVKVKEDADVSIVSLYPYDEGPQIFKSVLPGIMLTKKGGTVIIVGDMQTGEPFEKLLKVFDDAKAIVGKNPIEIVHKYTLERKPIVPNIPLDFNYGIILAALYLTHADVILVSNNVSKKDAGRLGFKSELSLDKAINLMQHKYPHAKINILPTGGLVIPVKEGGGSLIKFFNSECVNENETRFSII
jgi:lactate racemase